MARPYNWRRRPWDVRLSDGVKVFAYIPPTLVMIWQAAPLLLLLSTSLIVVQGLLPVASVFLTRTVVNQLVVVVDLQTVEAVQPALLTIGALAGVMVVSELIGGLASYIRMSLAEQVKDYLINRIHSHAITLDLRFYDSPDYYDVLFRASVDARDRPLSLLESINSLLQNLITLIAMAGVLLLFAWWIPLVLVMGTLPALWVALRATQNFHRWRRNNTVNERRLTYYQRTLIRDDIAAEFRLFDLGHRFQRKYRDLRRKLRAERLNLAKKQTIGQSFAALFGMLSMALILVYSVWEVLRGHLNLGDLAMLYQAMNQGQRLMVSILNRVGDVYRNVLFLEDLFKFLDLKPEIQEPIHPVPLHDKLQTAIEFNNVTFSYLNSDRPALKDFSLYIPADKVVAIVGENGAGKSTLIKLLCRFYDPQAGSILWDGVDLRQRPLAELRRRITVLFQRPATYQESFRNNIRLGDVTGNPTQAEIEEAAQQGGAASVALKLPEGYETVLGKWFGHTDLSVGEWQRVSLARAFLRQAELVILDEPTSVLDSWAEHAWMERFRGLVEGRTSIIITHRFTTAMKADLIYVMMDGQVAESGSHTELMTLGGRYAQSWQAQIKDVQEKFINHAV